MVTYLKQNSDEKPTQQSHTFASRYMPTLRPKLAKECACPTQKEFQNIFSNASKKIKTPDTQALTMQTADTYRHDNWTTEAHAHNKGLAKWRVQWLNKQLCYYLTLVLGDSDVLRMPPLRQAPKRWAAIYWDTF
jgi:hypothetical protein